MTVIVRDLRPGDRADAEGFAHVRRLAVPYLLMTPESVLYDVEHVPGETFLRLLVAEEDGEIVGTAQVGMEFESTEPGQAFLNVYVHPGRTRRGAGSLLVAAAEAHLAACGARRLLSWVLDAPDNRAFAERHGYRPSRSAHLLRLDLAKADLPPLREPPPGLALCRGSDFADDPRPVFALDAEAMADEPSDVGYAFDDYDAWLAETWHHPLFSQELTTLVVADGRPVAFSAARTDGGTRYGTVMTGTARAFRGRGLAGLAKNDSLHRARAAGCTEAFTGNDTANGPMLAINTRFGYDVCATEVRHVRELG
ncbi:GNAT family N-acetyltransferase [Streptomyces sp. NPDC090306]|uniref:GNAT family N-acetyltransferase n=1 Tax=Streptomyces sp. NPDC090306 TaxID=3365961 RepID=UPI0038189323